MTSCSRHRSRSSVPGWWSSTPCGSAWAPSLGFCRPFSFWADGRFFFFFFGGGESWCGRKKAVFYIYVNDLFVLKIWFATFFVLFTVVIVPLGWLKRKQKKDRCGEWQFVDVFLCAIYRSLHIFESLKARIQCVCGFFFHFLMMKAKTCRNRSRSWVG